MRSRYILAPEAALDLVRIWRYIKKRASLDMADRVDAVIREKIVFLAGTPGAGHWRRDLTGELYRPETRPLQVVAILHGQEVEQILRDRV
jgi:plasmid stabilization system protein ParE